jgi:hypothetical protein
MGRLTGTAHGDAVNALLKFHQEEAEKLETPRVRVSLSSLLTPLLAVPKVRPCFH